MQYIKKFELLNCCAPPKWVIYTKIHYFYPLKCLFCPLNSSRYSKTDSGNKNSFISILYMFNLFPREMLKKYKKYGLFCYFLPIFLPPQPLEKIFFLFKKQRFYMLIIRLPNFIKFRP